MKMQRRIGEDEVNLIVWLPCFYVLLYELGGDDAGTRDASLKANPVPMPNFLTSCTVLEHDRSRGYRAARKKGSPFLE